MSEVEIMSTKKRQPGAIGITLEDVLNEAVSGIRIVSQFKPAGNILNENFCIHNNK